MAVGWRDRRRGTVVFGGLAGVVAPASCFVDLHAAKQGHTEAVKTLLETGAPWNALNPSNLSAGDFAMDAGHDQAYELLLNAGIQAQLVLGTIARKENKNGVSNEEYLEDRVSFNEDKIMDAENKAVMIAWENPLMEAHAKAVCSPMVAMY